MSEYAYARNGAVEQIVDIRPDLYAQWVAAGNPILTAILLWLE